MSEQEIREGMLLAVWDEPPLDFDPDVLMRRVEQKKSRRRALVTVGVATAMIVVTAFALPGLLPRDRDSQLGSESQTNASAPPSESAEKEAQRLGDKLAERLGLMMPGLTEISAGLHPGRFHYGTSMVPTPPQKESNADLTGYVYLTDAIGPTALRVEGAKIDVTSKTFCSGAIYCRDERQSDGSTVYQAEYSDGGPDITRSEVVRKFQSGYAVRIVAYNSNPASGSGLRQTVPVRVEALTTLVTDPGIVWE